MTPAPAMELRPAHLVVAALGGLAWAALIALLWACLGPAP